MDFAVELKGFKKAIESMNPQKVLIAGKRAIMRAASSGKTIISEQVRTKFNIRKSDIDKKINIFFRNIANMEAILRTADEPTSLMYFKPVQIRGARTRQASRSGKEIAVGYGKGKGGVKVAIIRKRPIILSHAFISRGKGGTLLTFRRMKGTESTRTYVSSSTGRRIVREKIAAMKVIALPSIVKQPQNLQVIKNRIDEQLVKRFAHELDFEMSK